MTTATKKKTAKKTPAKAAKKAKKKSPPAKQDANLAAAKQKARARANGAAKKTNAAKLDKHLADLARDFPADEHASVPIGQIDPSPWQPRRDFPKAELQELADTIAAVGLIQRPLVRPKGKRFELVAGERRLRAAKLAGLATIPVAIRKLDEAAARELTTIENLQRRDLSAIEEAHAFRSLLDGDPKLTETALAKRIGKSQGHVANRLRLLGLPAKVQKRITAGTLPPTHARELVPYKDHPEILDAILKECDQITEYRGLPVVADFRDEVVEYTIEEAGGAMEGEVYDSASGRRVPIFTPTDEQREQLEIVELPPYHKGGKTRPIALNRKLYDKLQAAHAATWKKAKGGKKAAPAATLELVKKSGQMKPEELEMTAAAKKQVAAIEKEKAKERAETFARRLWEFRCDWLRYLLARWVVETAEIDGLLRLALLVDVQWARGYGWDRSDRLAGGMKTKGVTVRSSYGVRDFVKPTGELDEQDLIDVTADFLSGVFFDLATGEPNEKIVENRDVVALAESLGIVDDLEAWWLEEQAGPLSERFWNLHNKAQLQELGEELGLWDDSQEELDKTAALPKAAIVQAFLKQKPAEDATEAGLDLPAELAKCKRPK